MGFLNPWLLGGLGLLTLPLWLHLLRKHKSEPMNFSSLMFFEQHTQASVKHRRLDYILLLIARLALLTLVVLALAQPFFLRAGVSSAENRVNLLMIDESASMAYEDRLTKAKTEATALLNNVKPGSKWQVGAFAANVRMLTQPVDDSVSLKAAVQSLTPGSSRSSFGELARVLRAQSDSLKVPLEIHLFSDLQRTSLPAGFAEVRLGDNTTLLIHPVADKDRPNWAVETVKAPRRLGDPKKARVDVTVVSFATEAATKAVELVANGKTLSSKTITLAPAGRARAEFLGLDLPYGLNRCEIRIAPSDGLAADDRFLFSVERSDPRKIAFLFGPRAERSTLYVESALEAASENGYTLEAMPVGQATGLSFDKYAFVILSDVPELGSLETPLQRYVEGGGAVLLALGPQTATRPRVPLTGDVIVESRNAARSGERFQTLDTADDTHPALRRADHWANVKFYQSVVLKPADSRIIGRLSDQSPILLEKPLGEGRLLTFASTLDNLSNDFPLHPSFVPFIEQTANYLSGQEDRSANYTVDSYLELRQGQSRASSVEVLDPDGKRALELGASANAQNIPLPRVGFYELRRGAGRSELIAVNVDRRESDLALIPKDALELWQGGELKNQPGTPAKPEESKPWSVGRWILALAILALLAETWISSRTLKTEAA